MTLVEIEDLGTMTSDESRSCPVPFFKRLLDKAPVYRDPVTGHFVITRYADILAICDKPNLFRNQADIMIGRATSPVAQEVQCRFAQRGFPEMHTLSTADQPEHTRYRGLVDRVFTPTFVKALEPRIRAYADELIDRFIDRGKVDFLNEFAILLPMYVITEQLGLSRDDISNIKRWSDVVAERCNPVLAPDRELEIADELIDMQNYLFSYVERFRKEPQDNLLSRLANLEVDGDRLSDPELLSVLFQLMVGGNETSTTAILSLVREALARPQDMALMRDNPSLIPSFVEEVLRIHSPVPVLFRIAAEDTEVGGVAIPKGSILVLSWLGANHDVEKWGDPDRFDVNRKGLRSHLTFGRGVHFCIGHLLAKAELRIGLEHLLKRLPNMRLSTAHPEPRYIAHAFVHMLDSLHLEFDPPRAGG